MFPEPAIIEAWLQAHVSHQLMLTEMGSAAALVCITSFWGWVATKYCFAQAREITTLKGKNLLLTQQLRNARTARIAEDRAAVRARQAQAPPVPVSVPAMVMARLEEVTGTKKGKGRKKTAEPESKPKSVYDWLKKPGV